MNIPGEFLTQRGASWKVLFIFLFCLCSLFLSEVRPTAAVTSGATISGTVTFVGSGDKTIYVRAWRQDSGGLFQASPNSVTGQYSITGLPAGTYKLQFDTSGTNFAPQWWKSGSGGANSVTSASATVITLGATAVSTGKDATIRIGASMSGTVSSGGVALPGIQVQAVNIQSPYVQGAVFSAATNDFGEYRLQGLPPGSYKIEFQPNFSSPYVSQFWGGASTFSQATTISFTSGQALTGKNVSLVLGGTISGKAMLNGRTSPLQGIIVNLVPATSPQSGDSGYAETRADGTFSIVGIRPGKYKILFNSPYQGQQFMRTWWSSGLTTYESASQLTVSAGQVISDIGVMLSPVVNKIVAPAPAVRTSISNGNKTIQWTKPVTTEPIIGYNVSGMTVTTNGSGGGGFFSVGSNILTSSGFAEQLDQHSIDFVSAVTSSADGILGTATTNPIGVTLLAAPTIKFGYSTDTTLTVSAVAPASSVPVNAWAFVIVGGSTNHWSHSVNGCSATTNQSSGKITCTFTGLNPGTKYSIYGFGRQDGPGLMTVWGSLQGQATKNASSLTAQTPGRAAVTGTARAGSTLTATTSGWAAGTELAYEWFRQDSPDSPIATTKTYVATNYDVGRKLFVKVTGFKSGYRTVTANSPLSATLAGGQMTGILSTPTITGASTPNPVVGDILSGSYSGTSPYAPGSSVTQTYKWLRDGIVINTTPGATTYQLVQADVGHKISFSVTFSAPNYDSKTVVSSQTSAVIEQVVSMLRIAPNPSPSPSPSPTPTLTPTLIPG